MDWRSLHGLNEKLAISTCTILNISVLLLILTERSSAIKAYRKLIIVNALTELCATALMAVCQPVFQFLNGYFIVISNGPFRTLPHDLHYILIASWALGTGISFITVPLDFVYRFYVVCKEVKVKTSQIAFWVLVAYILAVWDAYWMASSFITVSQIELQDKLLNEAMWTENGTKVTFIASSIENTAYKVFTISGGCVICSEYTIIMILSRKIISKLKEQRHLMSAKTLEMQRGMNQMLQFFQCSLDSCRCH
ncbi:unnamed protein product [Bursaphelenchus xylophilus]|uniref:(pine wood nematode) hypothetical protein n=1 Tax=Bursaphelenchus xylophilus TaxID=6326 RepID=A0A7I8WLZ2_BURXY|nr:unnamed protein product [Bursaphelenchus xylophilus]CAG9104808.1 unnamed protein product [Bursaphelenchus xylophilus]